MAQGAVKNKKGAPEAEEIRAPSVADLEAQAMGPKAPEPAKKERADKKKNKPDAADAPAKSGGTMKVVLLVSLVWLVLISVCVLAVMFDPTEDKSIRNMMLLFFNPEEEALDDYYIDRVPELLEWERLLDEDQKANEAEQLRLEILAEQLDEREDAVADREDEADALLEELNEILTELKAGSGGGTSTPDLVKMAKDIAAMDPVRAARMLEQLVEDEADGLEMAARLCQLITSKKLGAILDAMNVEVSAAITALQSTPVEIDDYDF